MLELKVPEVGKWITVVQIVKWQKGVGERVEKDDPVVELESDKATVDLPAPGSGTISKMLKEAGQTAAVGEVIGYLAAPNEAASPQDVPAGGPATPAEAPRVAGDGPKGSPGAQEPVVAVEKKRGQTAIGSVQPPESVPKPPPAERPQPPPRPREDGNAPFVMPAAERALAEHGLSADQGRATGPGDRMLKEDVERRATGKPTEPPGGTAGTETPPLTG